MDKLLLSGGNYIFMHGLIENSFAIMDNHVMCRDVGNGWAFELKYFRFFYPKKFKPFLNFSDK